MPLKYYWKLLQGLFYFCVSVNWVLHLYFWVIVKVHDRPFNPFFNIMLDFFVENNMEFISTCLFVYLTLYILMAAFRGNTKFGLRFYLVTFYPMNENETFMGAFLFVAMASCIWIFTFLQLMALSFGQYI